MVDPVIEFYETDDATLLTNSAVNPLAYSTSLDVGTDGNAPLDANQLPVHLWNDNGGGAGSDNATNIKLYIKDSAMGDTGQYILGTVGNGNIPFYKIRSFGSFGAPDDNQINYTNVGGTTYLAIGNISSNQARYIWCLLDIPTDAVNDPAAVNKLMVSFDSTP